MFDFLQYSFVQRALVVGTLLAIIGPLVGIFLVVRRLSALADTLAHVSLIGVAVALVTKLSPINLALGVCMAAGVAIEKLRSSQKLYGESILVVFITGSLGISSVILSFARGGTAALNSFLFGSINTVTVADMHTSIGLSILVTGVMIFFYNRFLTVAIDEDLATGMGLPVSWYNLLLITLTAVVVSLGIQIVGVLLIGALMILPVVTAQQYQFNFKLTTLFASIFAVVSVWLGVILSYNLDLATGGVIILINIFFLVLGLLINRK